MKDISEDRILNYKEEPEVGEYVIVTIKEINPSSVIVDLDEYENKKGMIHISEISSRWVKDIRKEVKLNEKKVAVVIGLDRRGYVELSIKRVKPNHAREKTKDYKNEKKIHNFLKILGKELGYNIKEMYEKIGFKLQKEFGSMHNGFEALVEEGIDVLRNIGVDEKIAEKAYNFAIEHIKKRELVIKYDLMISCVSDGYGISTIKKILGEVKGNVRITYLTAPRYRLEIYGEDYKEIEKEISTILEELAEKFKKKRCSFNYLRVKDE